MAKSIIIIETEDLLIDGVPHAKRVIKENDNVLHEDTVSLESISKIATKFNIFMDWIQYRKNPTKYNFTDEEINIP